MSEKQRKNYSREFKMEAVGLITEKGYSIAEASRNHNHEFGVRNTVEILGYIGIDNLAVPLVSWVF